MSTIKASEIDFSFGTRKLFNDLSFEVKKGEICAILGPNGAGKTTLLKCLLKTYPINGGEILLDGVSTAKMSERALFRKIAYVPQSRDLPGSFTVLETVLLGLTAELGIFSAPGKKEIGRATEALQALGIEALAERRTGNLSGGELQMVLIARAMAKKPEVLILDEPESGLDFKNQLIVLEALRNLSRNGVSVLFNTHYPDHALRYADSAILLGRDTQNFFGPVSEIITEENIKKTFGVDVQISEIEIENTAVKSVVPIKII